MIRAIDRFRKDLANDKGVVLMVLVVALLVVAGAFIVTKLAMNATNTLDRTKATAAKTKRIDDAILAYFQANPVDLSVHILPCPDTDLDGDSDPADNTACNAGSGTLPYSTLNLGPDDVIDGYGNYFTYVVTQATTSRQLCRSISNDYNPAQAPEYTGTVNAVTDTEVRLSSQSAGAGAGFYYALISHGPNGRGGISHEGNSLAAPFSAAEIQNCPSNNGNCSDAESLAIFSGPQSTAESAYFDDQVFIGSSSTLRKICETLTPGGQVNTQIGEPFTAAQAAGNVLPDTLLSLGGTTQVALAQGSTVDYVLRFSSTAAAVETSFAGFNPAERALYVSFEWRPTAPTASNEAGISVGMRATPSLRGTGDEDDIFYTAPDGTDGLTFRFFSDVTNNANGTTPNQIYICDDVTRNCDDSQSLARSGADTFTITDDEIYTVEVYDDGVMLWARITQNDAVTNTATVSLAALPTEAQKDLEYQNNIVLLNHENSTSELDDLLVGRGMTSAAFDGIDDIASANTAGAHAVSGNITLEAWVRPDTYTGSDGVIMAKWTNGGLDAVQGYRLYLDGDGDLMLDLAGDDAAMATNVITRTYALGIRPTRDIWSHVAVSYDRVAQSVVSYLNGDLVSTQIADAFDSNGVQAGSASFSVGAELPGAANPFDGELSDIRVWNVARTAAQISANYRARLQFTGALAGLVANWTFDRDSGAIFGSTAVGFNAASSADVAGTFSGGASYIADFQQYFMPFSDTFCPSGTVVGTYECDFRLTTQNGTLTIPTNLHSIAVKAWGGGGGGYSFSASGGGGGFSEARLLAIDTQLVPGGTFTIAVGAGGTGSPDANTGAGGGGASGIWLNNAMGTDYAGVIAGGGGGASYGDDEDSINLYTPDCANNTCGPGGGGGGPFNFTALPRDRTARAADVPSGTCGGRGGDNSPSGDLPPTTLANLHCQSGGDDPVNNTGGSGGGSAPGGVSPVGSGGAGRTAISGAIGGGGGGGGVNAADFTSGGGEAGGSNIGDGVVMMVPPVSTGGDGLGSGWGGGGGSGFANPTVSPLNVEGVAGAAGGVSTTASAGNEFDPDYAGVNDADFDGQETGEVFCDGVACVSNPGRGGDLFTDINGQPGAVILKW